MRFDVNSLKGFRGELGMNHEASRKVILGSWLTWAGVTSKGANREEDLAREVRLRRRRAIHAHTSHASFIGLMPSDQSTWLIAVPNDGDPDTSLHELRSRLSHQVKAAQFDVPSFKACGY